jgi:hypothetical protein
VERGRAGRPLQRQFFARLCGGGGCSARDGARGHLSRTRSVRKACGHFMEVSMIPRASSEGGRRKFLSSLCECFQNVLSEFRTGLIPMRNIISLASLGFPNHREGVSWAFRVLANGTLEHPDLNGRLYLPCRPAQSLRDRNSIHRLQGKLPVP